MPASPFDESRGMGHGRLVTRGVGERDEDLDHVPSQLLVCGCARSIDLARRCLIDSNQRRPLEKRLKYELLNAAG